MSRGSCDSSGGVTMSAPPRSPSTAAQIFGLPEEPSSEQTSSTPRRKLAGDASPIPPMSEPSLHPAIEYLTALFDKDATVCLTFIHSTKTYPGTNDPVVKNVFCPLSEVITDAGIRQLTARNKFEHVYVSMAPFKPGSKNRTRPNIAEARHVFIEVDEHGDETLAAVRVSVAAGEIPAPTYILQSSPHKFQFIWNVSDFDIPTQVALNKTLQQKFNTDPQSVDPARVLRIPGFRNIKKKYGDSKPMVQIVEHNESPVPITLADFAIPLAVQPDRTVYPPASDAAVQQSIEFLEAAMDAASVSCERKPWDGSNGAWKFLLALCPWRGDHTSGGESDAMAIVQPSGAYGFKCLHAHCADKKWDQFREYLENRAGHKLAFSALPAREPDYPKTGETPAPVTAVVRPTLSETAYYGLAGAIVKKMQPQTEAHPAGLLVELMISFGSALGRCAYIQVEDTRHYTNEFMVKVGESSRARKGTGKDRIRAIMRQVDPDWLKTRSVSGIGSGEVIIHLVRDPHNEWVFDKKKGNGSQVMTDAGVEDKRLCVNLGEFQGILSVCHRPDNLLSVVMRDGWDGLPLHNLVKNNPASCAEGLLSLLADTTRTELSVSLSQAERNNGFANRFLWVYVYRTQLLPEGGETIDWTAEAQRLRDAMEFGRQVGRVFMDKPAHDFWCRTLYPKLEREIPGLVGALTARASAHTMRLALLYALLDKSDHIRIEHLEAAAALWQYCEDSVQTIFGDLLSPEHMKIMEFLRVHGAATKNNIIHDCFRGNRKADLIQADLDLLKSREKITVKDVDGVPQYRTVGH